MREGRWIVTFADLHLHTNASDGTFSPKELVSHAQSHSLRAIAVTDHDTVGGIGRTIEEASKHLIEVVPGVELTAEEDNMEVHILGYYIDWGKEPFVLELGKLCSARIKRNEEMVGKLRVLGFVITPEEVVSFAGEGAIGRLHLANVLVRKGYVKNVEQAFSKFIGSGKPAYAKRKRMTVEDGINLVKSVGGIPVLAHPGLLRSIERIGEWVEKGIEGIEVYHTSHTPAHTKVFLDIANQYSLLVTGGSDCHGLAKSELLIGTVKVPYVLVEKLRAVSHLQERRLVHT